MFGLPDPLSAIFLLCFFVGIIYVIASAALGLGHDALHTPVFGGDHGHADAGGLHSAGAHAGPADATGPGNHAAASGTEYAPSLISLFNIMAFLTWFGAAGYILYTGLGVFLPLAILAALGAGLLAAWLTLQFLVRVLLAGAKPAEPEQVEGKVGTVTTAIPADGIGEIVYVLGGARHSDGARAIDRQPIPKGTEVVITRIEKGIAYVQTWKNFTAEETV